MAEFLRIGSQYLEVEISPYGAALARVWLKGHEISLVLGLASAEDYADAPHAIGVIVGPVAGRVSWARTQISGRLYRLAENAPPHCLHCGPQGIQHQLWTVATHKKKSLSLQCDLADGFCGLPGNRTIRATYAVSDAGLELSIEATTDADTIVNATSHAYWCLDKTGCLSDHRLHVRSTRMCETGADLIPTGNILDTSNGPFDFTKPTSPVAGKALDGYFCLSANATQYLRPAMSLKSLQTGVTLQVETNQPGLVLYTAENMPVIAAPAQTPQIAPFSGLAIEAQGWPDANNNPSFPNIFLKAGTVSRQITRFSLQLP